MIRRMTRYAVMTLLALFVLTSLSCERDQFIVPEYEAGDPVQIILGFELPQKDEVPVTRSLTSKDEHHIKDFYLLIFNEAEERVFGKYYTSDEMNKNDFSGNDDTWASVYDLNTSSLRNPEDVDSTNGYLVASAVTGTCYIFGFANIGDYTDETVVVDSDRYKEMAKTLESTAVDKPLQKGLTSTRNKLDHVATLTDLYKVKMDAMASGKHNILEREEGNLTYSGAWNVFSNQSTHSKNMRTQGKVVIDPSWVENGVVDLRKKGMIYLRTLTAHVIFNIKINDGVFSIFKPESWQVVNLPQRAYLMDYLDHEPKRAEIEFRESAVMPKMLHDNGMFTFDFWMFENRKSARKADPSTDSDLYKSLSYSVYGSEFLQNNRHGHPDYPDHYLYVSPDADAHGNSDKITDPDDTDEGIINYYKHNFGQEITDLWVGGVENNPLPKLKTVYGWGADSDIQHSVYGLSSSTNKAANNAEAENNFMYDKREYQVKRRSSTNTSNTSRLAVWNRTGDLYPNSQYNESQYNIGLSDDEKEELQTIKYDSRKFVYADDKATYVVIKGRLKLANTDNDGNAKLIKMKNYAYSLGNDGYLTLHEDTYVDGYADVTYTIHLGNFGPESEGKRWDDFNILRNNEYIYTITINGLNSIYTRVQSTITNPAYPMKRQPGADGSLDLTMRNIYVTDAHFCQFNMMLTKSSLQNFFFVMGTPFKTGGYSSADIDAIITAFENEGKDLNDPSTYKKDPRYKAYAENPDFTWFQFRPCYDQSGMTLVDEGTTEDENEEFNAAKEKLLVKNRATLKYNYGADPYGMEAKCPKWNLFDFMIEMRKLNNLAVDIIMYLATSGSPERQSQLAGCTTRASVGAFLGTNPFYLVDYPFTEEEMDGYFGSHDTTQARKYQFVHKSPYSLQKVGDNWELEENPSATEEYWYFLDSRINRMFYTVYLDEYYYYSPPNNLSWEKPYWKNFANQPSRFVNFGYSEANKGQGYIPSPDRQSEAMVSLVSVIQPSIQTFYTTESMPDDNGHRAIGLEQYNETHNPRWIDTFNDYAEANVIAIDGMGGSDWHDRWSAVTNHEDTNYAEAFDTYNGWKAAWRYIVDKDVKWDEYVSDKVFDADNMNGIQINVAMKLRENRPSLNVMGKGEETSSKNDNQYLAGAIRMCMNRNRDEDGDGMIDAKELKWFLPSSRQLELAGVGHYSLEEPLFDYNKQNLISKDVQRFHNPPITNYDVPNLGRYHFVSSDYHILFSEEMANSPIYSEGSYVTRPYEMRCMRNLGGEYMDNGELDDSYVSWRSQTLLFDYHADTKIFDMKYFDSRTIRGLYYDNLALPKHFMFSTTNLPYWNFKVAKNLQKVTVSGVKTIEEIMAERPCKDYYDPDEGEAGKRSWRTPNHAELALMVLQLRQYNWQNNQSTFVAEVPGTETNPGPWFFGSTVYSCTSWNFTGYWTRIHSVEYRSDEGWGVHTTNISDRENHITEYNEKTTVNGSIYIRCVKDIR